MVARLCIITLWISFVSLLTVGLIMVASTSPYALGGESESIFNHYVTRQSLLALGGLVIAAILALYDYRKLKQLIIPIWVTCFILLFLCYVPGISKEINGESRWIGFGSYTFQPSEIAKIGIMICVSHWYSQHAAQVSSFGKGFLFPGIIFGIPVLMILCEKDMGTAAALSLSGLCLMYTAGSRWWMLLLAALLGALVLYVFTVSSENRMMRIDAWEDLEGSKLGQGRQQWLATLAFARGGLEGTGLGNGIAKITSLANTSIPEAHTDFIFASLGEELGLIGSGGVVIAFTLFTLSGLILAATTQDRFGRLLLISFTCIIAWPAMLNMMVVTAVVPNTGLPLPFISYGGTNLFFTTCTLGIITSIYIHSPHRKKMYWPQKMLLGNIHRKP